MSYSFSIDAPGMMPDVSRRIVLRFTIHPRLHLHEVDDQRLHETLVTQLLYEALAPFRRTAGDELSASYALQGPAEAELTIEGRLETRSALTCALRAIDLFARPKPFELESGDAFDDRRLYSGLQVQHLVGYAGSTSTRFEADTLAAEATVEKSLPSYLERATVLVRLETDALPGDPDDVAENLEAFLQNSCAVPRANIDEWLRTGGDQAVVQAGEDDGETTLRIEDYSGESASLSVFFRLEPGRVGFEIEPEDD